MNAPEQVSPSPEPISCPSCNKTVYKALWIGIGESKEELFEKAGNLSKDYLRFDGTRWVAYGVPIGGGYRQHKCVSPPDTSWFIFGAVEDIPDPSEVGYYQPPIKRRRVDE